MGLGLILIIVVAAYFIHENEMKKVRHEETPLETLKKRYVRGEISSEEFDQIKKDIE